MLFLPFGFKIGHVSAEVVGCQMANIGKSQIVVETANCYIALYNYVSRNDTCHFSLRKIHFRNKKRRISKCTIWYCRLQSNHCEKEAEGGILKKYSSFKET